MQLKAATQRQASWSARMIPGDSGSRRVRPAYTIYGMMHEYTGHVTGFIIWDNRHALPTYPDISHYGLCNPHPPRTSRFRLQRISEVKHANLVRVYNQAELGTVSYVENMPHQAKGKCTWMKLDSLICNRSSSLAIVHQGKYDIPNPERRG